MKRSRNVRGAMRTGAPPQKYGVEVSGLSRKKRRKLERSEKKVRRHAFHMKNKGIIQKEMERICQKLNITQKPSGIEPPGKSRGLPKKEEEAALKKPTKREREAVRRKNLLDDNKQEDRVIKEMEKRLFLNKRKNKNMPKSFIDEGLDYILEVVDKKYQKSHQESDDDDSNVYMNPAKRKRKLEESKSSGDTKRQRAISDSGSSGGETSEDEFSNDDSNDFDDDDGKSAGKSLSRNAQLNAKHQHSDEGSDSNVSGGEIGEHSSDEGDDMEESADFDEDDFSDDEGDVGDDSDECSSNDETVSGARPSVSRTAPDKSGKKAVSEKRKPASRETEESGLSSDQGVARAIATTETRKAVPNKKGSKNTLEEGTDLSSFDDESGRSEEEEEASDASEMLTERETKKQNATSPDGMWEDIYGRLRDKEGNVVSQRYVPPAKRLQGIDLSSKKKEQLARLKKQVKGLLNRLSEATVQPIGMEMEELYKKHSNNDVNSTLNLCLCESIIAPFRTPERLVMEHAMLVAYLHCNVGTEVGAQILQDMAEKFNDLYEQQKGSDSGKEVDNCALFISYLFVFKVVHSRIVYDIIRKMAESFNEKDVEIILLILRSVGFILRKHDPLALKEVVLLLQQKSAQDTAGAQDSRKRFMMETLTAVRNNNIQKIPNCDPSMVEHASKVLRGLFRKGCLLHELNISLEDLLKAHERGKWWVVGSAWVGNEESSDKKSDAPVKQPEFSSKILKLAQKHHMNTDVRRNIFCILMTAEDYLSASERILHLNLSAAQERELCYVALHCLLKEKQHNPFYAYLAQFFVKRDRRFYMSLQCAIWDKFKEVDKLGHTALFNLAEFLVILLTQEALSLAVLKTIQFVDMSPALLKFLRQLFSSLLLGRSQDAWQKVFIKVADAPKLRLLREGLCLFLRHFFLKGADMDPAARSTLQQRAELAEEALTSSDRKAIL